MILRWLATQLMQQAGGQKVRSTVSDALRQRVGELTRELQGESRIAGADRPDVSVGHVDEPTQLFVGEHPIAILFAMGIESGGFLDLLDERKTVRQGGLLESVGVLKGRPLIVAETGVGAERAAAAAEDLIALRKPSWIVSAGFAGSLHADLKRGHFLMAQSIADESGARLDVGLTIDAAQATKSMHLGRLLTVDRLIRTQEERLRLAEAHDAVACDMESAAVAEVCRNRKTRFLSVRIISDALDDKLPPEIERLLMQPTAAGKAGAAIRALVKRPSAAKDFWNLREEAMKASDRLAKFLVGVVDQLEASAATSPEGPAESSPGTECSADSG